MGNGSSRWGSGLSESGPLAPEVLLLFLVLWLYSASPRPLRAVSAMFLIGYGTLRFVAEFFRTPDPGIFGTLSLGLSTAQWLCVPMVVAGLLLLAGAKRREADR